MELAVLLFVTLIIFILIGVPISISLGASVIVAMVVNGNPNFFPAVLQRMVVALDSFPFTAIPFFILAGQFMEDGGISRRLVGFIRLFLRNLHAASACITTVSCAFFGAISGSSAATVAAIGSIMIPNMKKYGYTGAEASAIAASSAILGVIIPPSIPMITYSVTANVSIITMFIAGFFPGFLLVAAYILVHQILFWKTEKQESGRIPMIEYWKSFLDAVWALGMPIIILGGIYGGIFTPTEAGAVACVYALFVALFIYKEVCLRDIPKIISKSAKTTAAMLIIIAFASPFAWFMTSLGIPRIIANAIISNFDSKIVIFLLINVFLLFLGCFMETQSIILLVTPILKPIATSLGMDLITLGIMIVINTAIGMFTPPLAPMIFVSSGIAGEKSIIPTAIKILPYLFIAIIVLMIITYVPGTVTWVPSLLIR